jgi:elongator complex protein 1
MSLYEIQLSHEAVDVHVNTVVNMIAVLTLNGVEIFSYGSKNNYTSALEHRKSLTLSPETGTSRQIILSNSLLLSVLRDSWTNESIIFHSRILDQPCPFSLARNLTDVSISSVFTPVNGSQLIGNTPTGGILQLIEDTRPEDKLLIRLPERCSWTDHILRDGISLTIGLSRTGSLYANERLLCRNCTSFIATASHLIFTTSQHLLKFVHLTDVDQLEIPQDEPEKDERCRSIERGAKLITVMPSNYSVVLQMPRGNLETVYPRALVLAGIRKYIDVEDYKSAFLACRSHRVDMNIIHDHNPKGFIKNVKKFVDQVQRVEHIDLFLSQLKYVCLSKDVILN